MDQDSTSSALQLFDQLVELPFENRLRWLDDHADEINPATHHELKSLLAAYDDAGDFLSDVSLTRRLDALDPHIPGTRIDAYHLTELIGEGGFARVFRAQQTRPLRREVAVKIVKLGMDTRAVIARFELERQALALMSHPNIAAVHDAGATATGRPYFVMELVCNGSRITDFCDENKLDITQRVKLFIDVCLGMQHAHQKGVLHRDLKPSNILVTTVDGRSAPKIIDFGIAKAMDQQRLTDLTLAATQEQQLLGTPQYMSPEQARSGGVDVDTRSDIYSLGAVLYEMLAGRPPLEPPAGHSSALEQLQRLTSDVELPPPSTRADARRRRRELRGELDWIVGKCVEKNRSRRYESAAALAADLQAHLERRPVVAAPAAKLYRARKFVRRNQIVVIATAIVLAALVAASVISTIMAVRATRAERLAQHRFNELRDVALHFMFDIDTKLAPVPGTLPARVSLLQAAEGYLSELSQHATEDPQLTAQLGQAYSQLAGTEAVIGDTVHAAAAYDRAVEIFAALSRARPDDLGRLLCLAEAIAQRSSALRDLGRTTEQIEVLRGGVRLLEEAIARKPFKDDPSQLGQLRKMLVKMYENLADSLRISGRADDAMAVLEQALAVTEAPPRPATPDLDTQFYRSITLQKMGDLYEIRRDLEKAFASDSAALELLQAVADQSPKNTAMAPALARNHSRLGHVAWRMGRLDIAVEQNRKQYEIRKRLSDAEPASTLLRRDLGRATRQLGLAIHDADNQSREAIQLLDQSVELLGKLASEKPDDLSITEELAETLIARHYVRSPKDPQLSIADLNRSIELNKHVLSIEPNDSTARSQIRGASESLAQLVADRGSGGGDRDSRGSATTRTSPATVPGTME